MAYKADIPYEVEIEAEARQARILKRTIARIGFDKTLDEHTRLHQILGAVFGGVEGCKKAEKEVNDG